MNGEVQKLMKIVFVRWVIISMYMNIIEFVKLQDDFFFFLGEN